MDKTIATVSRTREILNQYGLHARKGYGQNFLVDASVVKRCAALCDPAGAVIEIGPGIGSLTQQLALTCAHVTSYEIDEHLIPVLQEVLSPYDNVEILAQDFLNVDLKAETARLRKRYPSVGICANLPYYITSPVLFKIMEEAPAVCYMVVMVQKEVADRFTAAPGSPDYGALTVEAACLYDIATQIRVPAGSFLPAPKVDSAVVQFVRRADALPEERLQSFFTLVRLCFAQRRKTIYNNLREAWGAERANTVLTAAGIDPSRRAQQMSLAEFYRLEEGSNA